MAITDLGLPAGVNKVDPTAINDLGVITAVAIAVEPRPPAPRVGLFGYVYEAGVWTDVGSISTLPSPILSAFGLNNAGEVAVGEITQGGAAPLSTGLVWRQGSRVTLPPLPGGNSSDAFDVNDAGTVVGASFVGGLSGVPTPVMWRGGVPTALPVLPGGGPGRQGGTAFDVNNAGQSVGTSAGRAALWQGGTVTDLGTLGGATASARRVNERGEVVGHSETAVGQTRAFLWRDGVMTDLGTLGGGSSRALGINDFGQVVGFSADAAGTDRAFLWHDGRMTDLGALPGYQQSDAAAINNHGQIAGASNLLVPLGRFDASRPTLWTVPVPGGNTAPTVEGLRAEPAAGALSVGRKACGGRFTACLRFRVADADGPSDGPFKVVVNWGDGTPWTPNTVPGAGISLLVPHDYAAAGTYRVTITVTDRRGVSGTASTTLTVAP